MCFKPMTIKKSLLQWPAFLVVLMMFSGCTKMGLYEQTASFKDQEWPASQKLSFSFNIEDSTKSYYNIYFVLRHADAYHFSNIWINYSIVSPSGPVLEKDAQEITLASPTAWLGTAMGDIVEQRISLTPNPLQLKKGNYQVSLAQIMREDPLRNILSAGIRVERVVR